MSPPFFNILVVSIIATHHHMRTSINEYLHPTVEILWAFRFIRLFHYLFTYTIHECCSCAHWYKYCIISAGLRLLRIYFSPSNFFLRIYLSYWGSIRTIFQLILNFYVFHTFLRIYLHINRYTHFYLYIFNTWIYLIHRMKEFFFLELRYRYILQLQFYVNAIINRVQFIQRTVQRWKRIHTQT